MKTVRVQRTFQLSAERVFDVLADHEGYVRFPGVRKSRLTRLGTTEKSGLGAIREVSVGGAWFEEEIVEFERPRLFGYRILQSRPPLEHQLGRITLVDVPGGVEVTWVSIFRVRVPFVSGVATEIAARQLAGGFRSVLEAVATLA